MATFIFEGETGGYLTFPCASSIAAVSGYLDVVDRYRKMYRYDGTVISGQLCVEKASLGTTLLAGEYSMLPQVVDIDTRIYYLTSSDLKVVEVPDFFSDAVVTQGSSILSRLEALENLSSGFSYFLAGEPIQTDKFLAFQSGYVYHADTSVAQHAGSIVGIAAESASSGDLVKVQTNGIYTTALTTFPFTGPALLGLGGSVQTSLPISAAFSQFVGIVTSASKIVLLIDPTAIIL